MPLNEISSNIVTKYIIHRQKGTLVITVTSDLFFSLSEAKRHMDTFLPTRVPADLVLRAKRFTRLHFIKRSIQTTRVVFHLKTSTIIVSFIYYTVKIVQCCSSIFLPPINF